MKYLTLIKILTISLFIASCNSDIPEVDTSDVKLEMSIKRLESELFGIENKQITRKQMSRLSNDFGDFFSLFSERIISVGDVKDSATAYYMSHFKNDPQVREIADTTLSRYPELSSLNEEFTEAFKRYKVLFPSKDIPKLYSFISAFSYTIVVADEMMGIGLDMYLGKENEYYKRLAIPAYRVKNMSREFILSDCLKSWVSTEFEMPASQTDLLSHMIYQGKVLYALDLLIPDAHDTIKIGYSATELKWVQENEKDMWFHFADKELFFNSDPKQIQKYVGEGPFTPGFPEGSPGMTGRWIGWQIVRQYMQQTDPLALKALMEEQDIQMILRKSNYKPQ